ncbi:hypothetical protein [Elongatibacter sediminis]|uniref:Uncharacterized protein n=1 Tax=Elongatibacter sediminis TaxID=3119006 RepID=A0AAW9RLM4_9GAMM
MKNSVAMIVRTRPYRQRSARTQLDVALLAAAVECPLRLYFLGAAALQLASAREVGAAQLPAGYRAWASLPELTALHAFVEPDWIDWLQRHGDGPVIDVNPMQTEHMRSDWRACRRVLVL